MNHKSIKKEIKYPVRISREKLEELSEIMSSENDAEFILTIGATEYGESSLDDFLKLAAENGLSTLSANNDFSITSEKMGIMLHFGRFPCIYWKPQNPKHELSFLRLSSLLVFQKSTPIHTVLQNLMIIVYIAGLATGLIFSYTYHAHLLLHERLFIVAIITALFFIAGNKIKSYLSVQIELRSTTKESFWVKHKITDKLIGAAITLIGALIVHVLTK